MQVSLHFFSIQIRIIALDNAPFHQKRRPSGHKRHCKRSPGKLCISAPCRHCSYIHTRRRQIWFYIRILPDSSSSGKVRIGKCSGIVSPNADDPGGGGRDRKCRLAGWQQKSGSLIQYIFTGEPKGIIPGHNPDRRQDNFPYASSNIGFPRKKLYIDFLCSTVGTWLSVV